MSIVEVVPCRITALQGASSAEIQNLLRDFAAQLASSGLRVAGVVECVADISHPCKSMALRSLDDGSMFSISQDLGPGSQACNLDPEGLVMACAAVQASIAHGADLVILSKFGKQEAMGRGLSDAFGAAISAGLPVLTAVSPAMMGDWRNFAGELAECVQADVARRPHWIDDWSRRVVTAPYARDMIQPAMGWIGAP